MSNNDEEITMSKQITPAELAEIITNLLTNPEKVGELCESHTYLSFVTDIAEVVCNHCGGEVRRPADFLDDACYVGIHGNDSLPEGGGIWAAYDKEGELFPTEAGSGEVQVDMLDVAARLLIPTDKQLWDAFWDTTEVSRNGSILGLDEALSRVIGLTVQNLNQLSKVESCNLAFFDVVRDVFWVDTEVQSTGAITGLEDALRRIAALEVRQHLSHTVVPVSRDTNLWRFDVNGVNETAKDLLHLVVDGSGGVTSVLHPQEPAEQRRALFLRDFLSV